MVEFYEKHIAKLEEELAKKRTNVPSNSSRTFTHDGGETTVAKQNLAANETWKLKATIAEKEEEIKVCFLFLF